MKSIVLKCLLVATAALALASTGSAGRSAPARSQADGIRALERALLQATVAGDTAAVRALLAPDFQLIDPFGSPESRAVYLQTIGGGVDFVRLEPVSPFKVVTAGTTALVRFRARFAVQVGPDRLDHAGWVTDVLQRRNGRWLFVWSQVTATPNDPGLFARALKRKQ